MYPDGDKPMEKPSDDDLKRFVGLNPEHYEAQWSAIESKKRPVLWHWRAFLFTPFWLSGRKLYFHAFLYYLILFFGFFFGALLKLRPILSFLLTALPYQVFVGLAGYELYRKHTYLKIGHYRRQVKQAADGPDFFKKQGGVSLVVGFIAVVLFILILRIGPEIGAKFQYWLNFGSES